MIANRGNNFLHFMIVDIFINSEYGRTVVHNVNQATKPVQTTVTGQIRLWWQENIGAPRSAL